MTISYNWLCDYLPEKIAPENLAKILTTIGLEVESFEKKDSIKGGLNGVYIGEVLSVEKHPNADRLNLTKVNIGKDEVLSIVCGAPNVAVGQKVVVATDGAVLYNIKDEEIRIKETTIRSVKSYGMICAEDEIGIGTSHDGIMVLPTDATVGMPASEYFKVKTDYIFEIGLTPNRMDAMSHYGVARDVCAYISVHEKRDFHVIAPKNNGFKVDDNSLPIKVKIENQQSCLRYSGVSISNITIAESPDWLKEKLLAIGQRPINNVVDITNFILHESGQPLHAFDLDKIKGKEVLVKNVEQDTEFVTLDKQKRKLHKDDLIICNNKEGMCIAGVYGGLQSGVATDTKNIFLESAYFLPASIRRTSLRHGLRTDSAMRFEKGVDISQTVQVLKRAAMLIAELTKGKISSEVVDVYPNPAKPHQILLKYHYLKELSGKNYHPDDVKIILKNLHFDIIRNSIDDIMVAVPFNKQDVVLAADVVEEIIRIDGLDNIPIPKTVSITPQENDNLKPYIYKEKISECLVGLGFYEIMTNSITNSAYYTKEQLNTTVKMLNNLSEDLNIMRPSMLETGLESVVYNLNRKNNNLKFFDFGKTYQVVDRKYFEKNHLSLFVTGNVLEKSWRNKAIDSDFYSLKGIVDALFKQLLVHQYQFVEIKNEKFNIATKIESHKTEIGFVGMVGKKVLEKFDIKQDVFFADLYWDEILKIALKHNFTFSEVPKYPLVQRDLALVLDKAISYDQVKQCILKTKIATLQNVNLFDVFESEKLGANKKSLAVNFIFADISKTMNDKEIDDNMKKIITKLETDLKASVRN